MSKHLLAICLLCAGLLSARNIFVDYAHGKNGNPGTKEKPLAKVAQGLKAAKPGDTVKILPCGKPIADTIVLHNVCGEPGKPIVIDGMGNTFTGEKKLNPKEWQEISPGLYRCKRNEARHNVLRYNLIHNGHLVRMGRATKTRHSAPFKAVAALQPGEWTVVDSQPTVRTKHPIELYLKLAEGEKSLADGNWGNAARFCGVKVSSYCSPDTCNGKKGQDGSCTNRHCDYLTIRNVIVTHFLNDGFNIHGNAKHIRFENVAAIECGDDGFSAHNTTEVTLENYVSLRNATAICHVNQAKAIHRNVYSEGSLSIDFYPCDSTDTTLENAWIAGDSPEGVRIDNSNGGKCLMKNVFCLNRNSKAAFTCNGTLQAENVHICGYKYPKSISGVTVDKDKANLEALLKNKKQKMLP